MTLSKSFLRPPSFCRASPAMVRMIRFFRSAPGNAGSTDKRRFHAEFAGLQDAFCIKYRRIAQLHHLFVARAFAILDPSATHPSDQRMKPEKCLNQLVHPQGLETEKEVRNHLAQAMRFAKRRRGNLCAHLLAPRIVGLAAVPDLVRGFPVGLTSATSSPPSRLPTTAQADVFATGLTSRMTKSSPCLR